MIHSLNASSLWKAFVVRWKEHPVSVRSFALTDASIVSAPHAAHYHGNTSACMFALPSPIPTTYFLNIDLSSYAPRYARYHYLYKSALVIWSSVLTCACLNHFKHNRQKQNLKLPNGALCPVLKCFFFLEAKLYKCTSICQTVYENERTVV